MILGGALALERMPLRIFKTASKQLSRVTYILQYALLVDFVTRLHVGSRDDLLHISVEGHVTHAPFLAYCTNARLLE